MPLWKAFKIKEVENNEASLQNDGETRSVKQLAKTTLASGGNDVAVNARTKESFSTREKRTTGNEGKHEQTHTNKKMDKEQSEKSVIYGKQMYNATMKIHSKRLLGVEIGGKIQTNKNTRVGENESTELVIEILIFK